MSTWAELARRARSGPNRWQNLHREAVCGRRRPRHGEGHVSGRGHPRPSKPNYYRREKGRPRFPLIDRVDGAPLTIGELDVLIDRAVKNRHRQRPVSCRTLAVAVMLASTEYTVNDLLSMFPEELPMMRLPLRAWHQLAFWLRWRQRLGLDLVKPQLFCSTRVSPDYLVTGKRYWPRRLWPGNVANDIRRMGDILGVPVTVGALRKCPAHLEEAVRRPARVPWLRRRWHSAPVRDRA